ncbi:hypothetical protein SNE40_012216 [Patella caerulea]|uniref:long-chain-fatty-acid--CoA ligase n=1 Tax=Patella caerulea TaxID=87958 RepID=A0AAN8PLJ3_PATCE
MYKKILYGAAGAAGASVVAWRTMFPWIGDDLIMMKLGSKALKKQVEDIEKGIFLVNRFEDQVHKNPDKVFIIYDDNLFTFKTMDEQANRVANAAKSLGLRVGDTVALFCSNSPEFIWTFLGLQKIGVIVAMVNTSIHAKALAHSVIASGASVLMVGAGDDLKNTAIEAADDMENVKIWLQGCSSSQLPANFLSFDDLMYRALPVPIDKSYRSEVDAMTTCCYIYTSGTTGLPKPTFIQQLKAQAIGSTHYVLSINENDILYLVLPLFHSAACMSLWSALNAGATVVLRKKFSASHFWQDVRKYNVTIFQYIGELCRYLLAQKPSELDRKHKVRAIIGNGLRKDIWTEFQTRYGIPFICEFFAATDGNTLLFNASNKPGAIGRLSPFMRRLEPNPRRLVKYDYNTAEPVRDKNGRCIEVDRPGEAGLFISFIPPEARNKPIYRAAAEATAKKIIRNAFVDGDEYYNYGDLLYRDKDYFLYFNDRIGDTFRWKGENVSTTEVANILTNVDFIQDANVYGVSVPGQDGRAGMAALTLTKDTNLSPEKLKKIYDYCEKELPRYARPIFLRNLEEDILTVTFKQKKNNIVKEGFNPMEIKDRLYFRDEQSRTYIPLTADVYPKVLKAKL